MRAYVIMKNDFPEHVIVSTVARPAEKKMAKLERQEKKRYESIGATCLNHWHIEEADIDIL